MVNSLAPGPWPLVSRVLLEQAVAVQLIQANRHEVHPVVPGPRLDGVPHVAVVLPGARVGTVLPVEEDVDAARGLAQHGGCDHPTAHVEEALFLEHHLDAALVAVLVPPGCLPHPGRAPSPGIIVVASLGGLPVTSVVSMILS